MSQETGRVQVLNLDELAGAIAGTAHARLPFVGKGTRDDHFVPITVEKLGSWWHALDGLHKSKWNLHLADLFPKPRNIHDPLARDRFGFKNVAVEIILMAGVIH